VLWKRTICVEQAFEYQSKKPTSMLCLFSPTDVSVTSYNFKTAENSAEIVLSLELLSSVTA